jgi:uncharacterized protein (DUF1800 family)
VAFDPIIAETRFGCGLSPQFDPARDAAEMLARLRGPDAAAARFAIDDFKTFATRMAEATRLRKRLRKVRGSDEGKRIVKDIKLVKKAARQDQRTFLWRAMMRRTHTADGLRERLAFFWADHFTALGKAGVLKRGNAPYVESVIRPHVTGQFSEMLRAVATHPLMLHYLDQQLSVGPQSVLAERRGKRSGLNENLAREILELHTLGVDGPYDQADVRQFAELLTGMSYSPQGGFKFRKDMAEPGAEEVLGVAYGGGKQARLGDILAALDDLARHPDTGRHLARKLAVHFLGDAPDAALVDHLAARFIATDGDLGAVTQALLEHPAAWASAGPGNIRQPVDFVGAAMRALAVAPGAIDETRERRIDAVLRGPMAFMGQLWETPLGPDGWPEEDAAWITPQRFAARLDWAMSAPQALSAALPDPRQFAETALGGRAAEATRFAARAAEDRRTGIGLILMAPEFQRT